MNNRPLTDLEVYELIVAAYPEKFDDNGDNDIWDDVMEFAEEKFGDEFGGLENFCDFMGRVVMLTNPSQSAICGTLTHCLGTVAITGGSAVMMAAVKRDVNTGTPG